MDGERAMNLVRDATTIIAVCAGILFFLAGTVGLLRFPDTLSRLHALTKADNLGLGLIVFGCVLQAGGFLAALRLIAIWVLILLGGSAVSQLIARRAYRDGPLS
jgi:multicomponent Na+:H+ antiporter subunit G